MKSLEDLKFSFECMFGLDPKLSLEEVLEEVDKNYLGLHNQRAIEWQQLHQYRLWRNRLEYELEKAKKGMEEHYTRVLPNKYDYYKGQRDILQEMLTLIEDWMHDSVQTVQIKTTIDNWKM
jgi:hypothetical protein